MMQLHCSFSVEIVWTHASCTKCKYCFVDSVVQIKTNNLFVTFLLNSSVKRKHLHPKYLHCSVRWTPDSITKQTIWKQSPNLWRNNTVRELDCMLLKVSNNNSQHPPSHHIIIHTEQSFNNSKSTTMVAYEIRFDPLNKIVATNPFPPTLCSSSAVPLPH